MTESIEIKVIPTLTNFRWLNYYALKKKIKALITILFILLLLFSYSDYKHSPEQVEIGPYLLKIIKDSLVVLSCVVLVFFVKIIAINRQWNNSKLIRENRAYIFSNSDIKITGDSFNATIDWSHIKKAVFTKNRILLINTQNQYYLIPTVSLPDNNIKEAFKSLIKSKIENIKEV